MKIVKHCSNPKGSALVTSLVATAIVGFVLLGMMAMNSMTQKSIKVEEFRRTATYIQEVLVNTLDNNEAWGQTVVKNSLPTSCLKTAPCAIATPNDIQVYKVTGDLLFPDLATKGLQLNGFPCATDSCPLKFRVQHYWKCTTDPNCKSAIIIEYVAPTSAEDQANTPAPLSARRLDFVRGEYDGSLAQSCASVGGIFNQGTGRCQFVQPNTDCGDGEYAVGFDSNNAPVCQPADIISSNSCPEGYIIVGYTSTGSFECKRGGGVNVVLDPRNAGSLPNHWWQSTATPGYSGQGARYIFIAPPINPDSPPTGGDEEDGGSW